ncbi:hypothetical protein AWENTII_001535 [Aspergillus wentii]
MVHQRKLMQDSNTNPKTETGKEQSHHLQSIFPHHANVELIAASPLRRTIYTAMHAFRPAFDANPDRKLLLLPDLQEYSGFSCDIGSEVGVLGEEMRENGVPVDMGLLGEGWEKKTGRYEPTTETISARCRDVRCWLKDRPEKEIVLVTHGGLLHYLTEDWEDACKGTGTGWTNTEYRSYVFTDDVYDDLAGTDFGGRNATLVETGESRARRGLKETPPSREEQKELYKLGRKGWEAQGLYLSPSEMAEKTGVKVTEK